MSQEMYYLLVAENLYLGGQFYNKARVIQWLLVEIVQPFGLILVVEFQYE